MFILLCFYFLVLLSPCQSHTPVTVKTNVGSIMGFQEYISIDGEQNIVSKFLGVPYAESTAGANRFRKPVPKAPFQSTFDARKVPMACFQQSIQEADLYKNRFGVPGFSEDCLTLNIYVPHGLQSNNLLPVMIWIHGGGFTQGAASIYNPEVLAVFGNVIVVTINYRVGMFGFLRDKHGVFPGNQGLWDQQMAIKWVNDNIDMFNGYKDEIIIFGESAGGSSALLQALYPGNKGLFKRVIAESGTPFSSRVVKDAASFNIYLNDKGCSPDSATFVSCLQSKTPDTLHSNITYFGPVVDGDFLVATPREIMRGKSVNTAQAREIFASLDIITGVNNMDNAESLIGLADVFGYSKDTFNVTRDQFRNEIIPFVVNSTLFPKDTGVRKALETVLASFYIKEEDAENYVNIRESVLELENDVRFFAPTVQTANAHSALKRGSTYFYEFAVQVRKHVIPMPPWLNGSNHVDEIQYVHGVTLKGNISIWGVDFDSTPQDEEVSRAMMAFWSNFAKSGNPNVSMDVTKFTQTTWPEYTPTSHRYFRMTNEMSSASVQENFYPKRMAIWSDVISLLMNQQQCSATQPDIFHIDPIAELVG